MGGGRWDPGDWQGYTSSQSYSTKSTQQIFSQRGMHPDLDPSGPKIRESRDSDDNPNSTPLIVGLDVTGSMSAVLDAMARQGLNTTVTEVYDRKPITDPHILCAAIGDVHMHDRAPLQITQFEADIRIAKQLEQLWLEGGGGGNGTESYALLWYFAAHYVQTDAWDKRQKKGYLFTVGDEGPTPGLSREEVRTVFGMAPEADVNIDALLTEVSRRWEVFHVVVNTGVAAGNPAGIKGDWNALLGERVLWLQDHTKLAETIVSAIQVVEGHDKDAVLKSWDGSTNLVVASALKDLTKAAAGGGVVRL